MLRDSAPEKEPSAPENPEQTLSVPTTNPVAQLHYDSHVEAYWASVELYHQHLNHDPETCRGKDSAKMSLFVHGMSAMQEGQNPGIQENHEFQYHFTNFLVAQASLVEQAEVDGNGETPELVISFEDMPPPYEATEMKTDASGAKPAL